MANVTIGADEYFAPAAEYTDSAGNPATVDGPTRWESGDPALIEVRQDAAGADVFAAVGPMTVSVEVRGRADADKSSGVRELIIVGTVEIVAAEAIAGSIRSVSTGKTVDLPGAEPEPEPEVPTP